MQEIIKELNVSLSGEDLFLAWQNELRLRQQIRINADREVLLIDNNDEFRFIKRCFYYGPKQDIFYEILYQNMANPNILACVLQSPPELISGFLTFLGRCILDHKPPLRNLQFLINIYRDEFRTDFIELINKMDSDLCAHLYERTSNKDLRKLLKYREPQTPIENKPESFGFDTVNPLDEYPTLYGDKIQIMIAAIKLLKASQTYNSLTAPLYSESAEALLEAADMLFRAGLLADCLAILTGIINSPGMEGTSLLLSNEEPYLQNFDRLLRGVLPIYSLLVSPSDPHRHVLDLYRTLFPGFYPDPASLLYLDVHSIVIASLQGHRQYAQYELAQKGGKILSFRPDDTVASILIKSGISRSREDLLGLEEAIKERLPYHPHEVYIIMEMLRLWQSEGRLTMTRLSASNLLNGYLQFFYWIPAAPFMNEQVQNQLGLIADEKTRTAGRQILAVIQESPRIDLVNPKVTFGKISDYDNYKLQQRLLLSKFMGVF